MDGHEDAASVNRAILQEVVKGALLKVTRSDVDEVSINVLLADDLAASVILQKACKGTSDLGFV